MKYSFLSWFLATASSLYAATFPAAYFSDSFSRTNLAPCALGLSDNFEGGPSPTAYLPIFPEGGTNASKPVGAIISSNSLQNVGLDFGGVQFTTASDPCNGGRGANLGQDIYIGVSVLVPSDANGNISYAGPYFRSRSAASGDGIIGGTSGGFWVQLLSTGEIRVVRLNPFQVIARSPVIGSFDPSVFHRLQAEVQGNTLFVALDANLQTFRDANGFGGCDNFIVLPDAGAGNAGAAGIAFGTDNRGQIGGQRVDDLVVAPFGGTVGGLPSAGGSTRVIGTNEVVVVQGNNVAGSQLLDACAFLNHGIIQLTAIDSTWSASIIASGGYLTNSSSGLIEILPGSGGPRGISADIVNAGIFQINSDLSLNRPGGLFDNFATLNVGTNVSLQFDQSGGEVLNQDAGTLTLNMGSSVLGSHGQFNQNGGVLNVSSNVSLHTLFFTYNGGQINGVADFIDTDLKLNSAVVNPAIFTLLGANRLLSDVPSGQTISVLGGNSQGSSLLTSTNGFANRGVIRLETVDSTWSSALMVNSGVLSNTSSGVITVEQGAGGPRAITAQLRNDGSLKINQDLQITQPLDNQGTINIATNVVLRFEQTGLQIFNQNNGSLTLNNGSQILGSHGQFNQDGGVLNVSSNVSLHTLFFTYNGGQINGVADFIDTDLKLSSGVVNPAIFRLLGANRLLSDVPSGQTISVLGGNSQGSSLLTSTNGFANRGVIRLETVDSTWSSALMVNSGVLTNTSSGVITVEQGAGGPRAITAQLRNDGSLTINQDLQITQPLDNQGTINIATNVVLRFEQTGLQILNQNNGSLTLNNGSQILGSHGQFNQDGGVLNVSSNVSLHTLFFTYNGGQINGVADFIDTDLKLSSGVVNPAIFTLLGANRLLSDVPSGQTISVLGGNSQGSSLLTSTNGFANRGVIRLETVDSTWSSALMVDSGVLTNTSSGIITVEQGAGGPRAITAQLRNDGSLKINQDLQITQPLDNQGTINIATNVVLRFEQTGLQIFNQNNGSLTLNNGSQILGSHGQFNQDGGVLNVSSNVSLHTLFFTYNGGQINGVADFIDTDLKLSSGVVNPAIFTLLGANRLLSDVPSGQTISILGGNSQGSSLLTSTNGFINHGVLLLETVDSTWASSLVVNNGALTNESDGVIQINPGAGGPRGIDAVLSNRGTINVNFDVTLQRQNAIHNNRGAISAQANATLIVNGQLTQSDGKISLAGGAIQSAMPLVLTGGVLTGAGRVASDVQNNGGDISALGGELEITGGLTQTALGSITLRTKGAPQFGVDPLIVDGPVKLAGTLDIQAPANYTPHAGDRFLVISGQSISGAFDKVNAPLSTNQTVWNVVYLPTSVEVRIGYATNAVVFTELTRSSNGEVEFSFAGQANTRYSIEGSQDLINWTVLTNYVQPATPFPFIDRAATNLQHRFYRARSQ